MGAKEARENLRKWGGGQQVLTLKPIKSLMYQSGEKAGSGNTRLKPGTGRRGEEGQVVFLGNGLRGWV